MPPSVGGMSCQQKQFSTCVCGGHLHTGPLGGRPKDGCAHSTNVILSGVYSEKAKSLRNCGAAISQQLEAKAGCPSGTMVVILSIGSATDAEARLSNPLLIWSGFLNFMDKPPSHSHFSCIH